MAGQATCCLLLASSAIENQRRLHDEMSPMLSGVEQSMAARATSRIRHRRGKTPAAEIASAASNASNGVKMTRYRGQMAGKGVRHRDPKAIIRGS